ncbi:PREDICTED: galactolipase DONGLE, chloroplastic-like [Populus euphratica]|uniref:Galactolipase DONGLE, chloroplastic-like n=1 Tax=Populus euphratica TaxID=75702 RepID=A0AAJ6V7V2_POPEU|nr:PREDICTED: galactolipase DONGLE, chloroplastic-like [Populus euphratica]
MASKVLMPNIPSKNHVAYSGSMVPRSHSSGHLCLPKKRAGTTTSRSQSHASSFTTPAMSTGIAKTSSSTGNSSLAHMWREVQGCNNWDGLVEPLHPFLRQEIIRYGEFVTACYEAFDLNPKSKRYLTCKYGKKNLFREVGMGNSDYEVTKYIYATPDVNIPIQNEPSCGRWIGYVAVSSDDAVSRLGRRDIVITFRGTVTNPEWISNLMSSLTPARLDPNNPRPEVKVESGFLSLYTSNESDNKFGLGSCREQLLAEVSRLLNRYKGEELSISLAGHSMGSSLALLLAYDISELGLNRLDPKLDVPVTVFSFGGPRVGNSSFKERCEELGVKVLRIANVNDPITKLPGVLLNENLRVFGGRYEFPWSCSCYEHVGVEIALDFFNMQNPSCVHDLGSYISLLKCLKRDQVQKDEENLFNRARESILSRAQNINMEPLKNAASNVVNLVQSQRTELLMDATILSLMNSFALYILL